MVKKAWKNEPGGEKERKKKIGGRLVGHRWGVIAAYLCGKSFAYGWRHARAVRAGRMTPPADGLENLPGPRAARRAGDTSVFQDGLRASEHLQF